MIENARKIENRLALQILKILIIEERSIENARKIENRSTRLALKILKNSKIIRFLIMGELIDRKFKKFVC